MNINFSHILTFILFLNFTNLIYSQESTEVNKASENDKLKGRHFDNYIIPKDKAIKGNDFFTKNDRVPTFKKKCKKLLTNKEREKCFNLEFYDFLRKKIRIPNSFYKEKKTIELVVEFEVNKIGNISEIKIIESNDSTGDIEKEIIRVINKLPKMESGIKNNKPVKVKYSFPIKYSISY